jgi:substrate import-associated zinc metallohydrolase lipoprotein
MNPFKKNSMKKIKILLIALAVIAMSGSCSNDDLNPESVFKDPDPTLLTEFDKWILTNYTYTYNMSFKYKMEDIESLVDYDLVPASIPNSIAVAKIIKHLWMEVYDQVGGVHFTRAHIPKVIHLIGSRAHRTGSSLLGSAEGGMKITLFDVNSLDLADVSIQTLAGRYLKTMYHEFTHILQQAKTQPVEFDAISNQLYVGNTWTNFNDDAAYPLGFVSAYSRAEAIEDFAEVLAIYAVHGQENWNEILTNAGEDGAAIISQKLELVRTYLRISWNIELDELRRVFELRAATLHQLDLSTL